jgi:integrase
MSIKVRPFRSGGWEVDLRYRLPNGTQLRERRKAPVSAKAAAHRWGEQRERELLLNGPQRPRKEVPRLSEYTERFINGHAKANRLKPSGIASQESVLRCHLVPVMGSKKLDAITTEDVQRLKQRLEKKSPKTVNNILSVLSVLLKKAVEWEVIDRMPCTIRLLPVPKDEATFYDFGEYERLVEAAESIDARAHLIVLLGGEAGLRCGEMMALEWTDVDLTRRQLCIQRSDWKGHVTTPKGGRLRYVPMTLRLAAALKEHRHLRCPRVLCQSGGMPLTQKVVQDWARRAARRAGLAKQGVHILRHTFCSHLAMKGAPARAIQDLAGHADLGTTQRYMHLSPMAIESAIRLLDRPTAGSGVKTAEVADANSP